MRIALVSEEGLFRDGITALLTRPGIRIVSVAADVRSAIKSSTVGSGDLVLIDGKLLHDRDRDYLAGAKVFAGFNVLLLSDEKDEDFESLSYKAGRDKLMEVLSQYSRRPFEDRPRGRFGRTGAARLAPKEYEVARLVADGRSTREVAEILQIGEQTVRNYVHSITRKLAVRGRSEFGEALSGLPGDKMPRNSEPAPV